MTTQHTQGPWTLSEEYDGTSVKAGQFYVTHAIQNCGFHEPEVDKAVTKANARLIAAAPDLLEALRKADQFIANGIELGFIRMPDADTPDPAHKTPEIVRAAIAKATGEQA